MTTKTPEQRVMVLLNLLDPLVAESVLKDLPPERQRRLSETLRQLKQRPPNRREVHDVLHEFDRLLRIALQPEMADNLDGSTRHGVARGADHEVPLSDNPFEAITQVREIRLVAALRDEAPRTVALILNCLPEARAARILQQLSKEQRDAVVLQLKEPLTPSIALMTRLLDATITRCQSFVEKELLARSERADARVARLLRTMEAERRGEVLQFLETADPEATEKIRNALFSIDDLLRVEDKTVQKIAAEVDTRVLALVIKSGGDNLRQRVLANLSKRGRESLIEELDLMTNVSKAEVDDATKSVLKVMMELDKLGELRMETA